MIAFANRSLTAPPPVTVDHRAGTLEPLTPGYFTTNQLSLMTHGHEQWVVKQYLGARALDRCRCELETADLWLRYGFRVPEVLPLDEQDASLPILIRRFVDGVSLRQFLSSDQNSTAAKLAAAAQVCSAMAERHRFVLNFSDPRFIHPDANTGNIVLESDGPVWIDFETRPAAANPVDAAAVELSRFSISVAQDLTRASVPAVVDLVCRTYEDIPGVLERVWQRTLCRPLQRVHRWRDCLRKSSYPERVTKYDIADAMQTVLRPPRVT